MNGYTLVFRINCLRILARAVVSRTAVGMERVVDRSVPPAARLRSTDLTILATHSDGGGDLPPCTVYTVQSDPSHSSDTDSILSHSVATLPAHIRAWNLPVFGPLRTSISCCIPETYLRVELHLRTGSYSIIHNRPPQPPGHSVLQPNKIFLCYTIRKAAANPSSERVAVSLCRSVTGHVRKTILS